MKTRSLMCTALLVSVALGASTRPTHDNAGATAFPFLSERLDIRALGMGSASMGMPNGVSSVLGNVGSLGFLDKRQILVGYRPIFMDLGIAGTPVAIAVPRYGDRRHPIIVAASLIPISYGSIEETIDKDVYTGNVFRPYSISGGVSVSTLVMEGLGAGVTLKGIYDVIASSTEHFSADGAAIDVGAQYRTTRNRFICGIAISNLGFVRDFYAPGESTHPPLPLTFAAGVSFSPAAGQTSRFALDLVKRRGDFLTYSPGLEVDLFRNQLLARIGYSFSHRDLIEAVGFLGGNSDESYQKTHWSGLCLGVGVNPALVGLDIQLDMAYETRAGGLPATFAVSALIGF